MGPNHYYGKIGRNVGEFFRITPYTFPDAHYVCCIHQTDETGKNRYDVEEINIDRRDQSAGDQFELGIYIK